MIIRSYLLLLILVLVAEKGLPQGVEGSRLTEVSTDKEVVLGSLAGTNGMVLIFVGSSCPYVSYYQGRLKRLIKTYESKGISFVLINTSEMSIEKMKRHKNELGLGVSYLADKNQQLLNSLGASKIPEAFLLIRKNKSLGVVYHGAIDSNPQVADDVKENYLEDAIKHMLQGDPIPQTHQRAMGCIIRKK
ncbi:MAG: redoxin family protein [Cyclobacteriaceae bacterium]|nr:redoxin family protein [Cyclobacteriaceae bacterium]